MRFDIVTIFPEAFSNLEVGLLARARESGILEVVVHDLREWTDDPHRRVDDEPFGGGPGMVMTAGPIVDAVSAVKKNDAKVAAMSAAGRRFNDAMATAWASESQIVLVCGRYEGIDQRAIDVLGAEEVSIGDFVLTGGETAAAVIVEAVSRRLPGYMGNEGSLSEESFTKGLLEYPQYTRPADFRGHKIPEVLVEGDHARVAAWRRQAALRRTFERRSDLLPGADLTEEEREIIAGWAEG
jgi:tRNA (guanine37-N1)-methyltransferase